uniref:Uncharacterized protein n=1 Tax=Arundo donax TaxID=35708 RepID=A0A0A9HE71_ARUDO
MMLVEVSNMFGNNGLTRNDAGRSFKHVWKSRIPANFFSYGS